MNKGGGMPGCTVKSFSITTLRIQLRYLSLCLLLLVPSIAQPAVAPDLTKSTRLTHFSHLTINNGLSQSTVMSVVQGPRGFMWFGTQDGLNRYDGYEFRIFRPSPDDRNSLPDNNINVLLPEPQGYIWVGTNGGGLARLDTQTNQIVSFQHESANKDSLAQNRITALAAGDGNTVWIGTRNAGVDLYIPAQNRFRHFQPPSDGACDATVLSLLPAADGGLWIGTQTSGLCYLNGATGQWRHQPLPHQQKEPPQIKALAAGTHDSLWVGTDAGLYHITVSGKITRYQHQPGDITSLSNNDVHALLLDNEGRLWVGTQYGLNRLVSKTTQFLRYFSIPGKPDSLSGNSIGALHQDVSGLIWVGTLSSGLSKLNLRQEVFKGLMVTTQEKHSLSNPVVWNITRNDEGVFWIGTESGLNRYNPETQTYQHFYHEPDNPNSLAHNNVRDLLIDNRDRLWLATRGGGLDVYYPDTDRFEHYQHEPGNPYSLGTNYLLVIQLDADNGLWIGTAGEGLAYLDFVTGRVKHYRHIEGDPHSLPENNVYEITPDGKGGYWLGTLGGLSHFDPATGRFETWTHDPNNPQSLSNNGVGVIVREPRGGLWVGTDIGLNYFDPATEIFTRYTVADGLPNDFIYGILRQNDGSLWVSTNRGLSHFRPNDKTRSFTNYTVHDGLLSNEFNTGAYFKDDRGWLYFGSVNGLVYFDPLALTPNRHKPPVVITNFKVFDQALPFAQVLANNKAIELSYNDSYFSVQFAALDFTVPSQNNYAYRLEGFDERWINSGNRRYATYTNLDGGEYILHVKASNNDGIWNEEGIAVPITVAPPPWKTWWAYTLYGLLLFAAVYVLAYWRIRRSARAMAEKLRNIGGSFNKTLELDSVMRKLLEGLQETMPYKEAHALVYHEGEFIMQASIPASDNPVMLSGNEKALLEQLPANPRILAIADPHLANSTRLADTAAKTPANGVRLRDSRLLILPLVRDQNLLGAIMLYTDQPGSFTNDRLELASMLLNHASMAVQNAELFSEIRRMAITDELTGLFNRREFFAQGIKEYQRACRYQRPLACIMLDIDHFKNVNDERGHSVGDAVLREVGRTLLEGLRKTDLAARYGGEEFVLLLPETDLPSAMIVATRLHRAITTNTRAAKGLPGITVSMGLAVLGGKMLNLEGLVEVADKLLYRAKNNGRNRIVTDDQV
ncbi:MAG TPA: diguanylate cyclase [Gammaproteobacteria bacterium]|nr:diguanylate cyclase [Gammaproteobacteria bacterium]